MPLKVQVKVGNITNLSDARYCAAMGVDLVGFSVGCQDAQIDIQQVNSIMEWVKGPKSVWELCPSTSSLSISNNTMYSSTFDYISLHLSQLHLLHTQANMPLKIIIELDHVGMWEKSKKRLQSIGIAYLVVKEFPKSTHEWEIMQSIKNVVPVFLQYNDSQIDMIDWIDKPLSGIVLEGTREDVPGTKDYDVLANVLEQLTID